MVDGIISYRGLKWVLRNHCPTKFADFQIQEPSMSARLAKQIVARDIDWKATLRTTMPNPDSIGGMLEAAKRFIQAIENKETIAIYADYDVDGTSSGALLKRYLKDVAGVEPLVYVPHRMQEGYGANTEALEDLHAQGARLVVMVDCGTNAPAPLNHARQIGLDVIVIDHHKVTGEQGDVVAFVNPHQEGCASPESTKDHCAAGLVFLFLVGVHKQLRQLGYPDIDLKQYLDLVALATVCDVMPLRGLNRVFVRRGLEVMNQRGHAGLCALIKEAGVDENAPITTYHLGYVIGPRINAAGRMDHAGPAIELLSESGDVLAHAQTLNKLNQQRQELEQNVLDESLEQVNTDDAVLLVDGEGWHPGLIGIVAGRIKERFHKPACVIAWQSNAGGTTGNDIGKASGRSMPGFDLGALIHQAVEQGFLRKGGGHSMAVGFEVERSQYPLFKNFIQQNAHISGEPYNMVFDDTVSISGVTEHILEEWKLLEPFGPANPTPRLVIPSVRLTYASVVGKGHIKARWMDESGNVLSSISWRIADEPLGQFLLKEAIKKPLCHILGMPQWNDYSQSMQWQLEDIVVL